MAQGYDLIGDVHGCSVTLEHLLQKLGYRLTEGAYRHPERQAVFIGDIVDRGPHIREALHLVRNMVECGAAQMVLGNHEYNCLAYLTPGRAGSGREYLREHNRRHDRLIHETLTQFADYPDEWQSFLDWFREIPIYLEIDGFRVIHACWDDELIKELKARNINDLRDLEFLHRSVERGCFEWQAMDRLLRGTNMPLPNNEEMVSDDGYRRHTYRTKFWSVDPQVHGDLVFQPDPLPPHLAEQVLTDDDRQRLMHYDSDQPPLFIGHYWREGIPAPITDNIACIDYSAVKYGKLVAYRMDGERRLDPAKFVWIDVENLADIPGE